MIYILKHYPLTTLFHQFQKCSQTKSRKVWTCAKRRLSVYLRLTEINSALSLTLWFYLNLDRVSRSSQALSLVSSFSPIC